MDITFNELSEFANHPGFELYNMIINAQIEKFRENLEAIGGINPLTKERYTETDYEVMRYMINNLREIKNAPIEYMRTRVYELELSEQETLEEIVEVAAKKTENVPKKRSIRVKGPKKVG